MERAVLASSAVLDVLTTVSVSCSFEIPATLLSNPAILYNTNDTVHDGAIYRVRAGLLESNEEERAEVEQASHIPRTHHERPAVHSCATNER